MCLNRGYGFLVFGSICFEFRLNVRLVFAIFLLFLSSFMMPRSFAAAKDVYANLFDELKSYCVAEVCLGSTISEVSAKGHLEFLDHAKPDGQTRCSKEFGDSANATLTTKDGRFFRVYFELVSLDGDPKSRYRVSRVWLNVPKVTDLQLDHLREVLTDRYGLRKPKWVSNKPVWIGPTKSMVFNIAVEVETGNPELPRDVVEVVRGVSIYSMHSRREVWLMEQDECKSKLPKV